MIKRLCLLLGCIFLILWQMPTQSQTATAWEFLGMLNEARIGAGLAPLAMNSQLTSAAQRHSNDMATQDTLFHQGSDGTWFWDRVNATGYPLVNGAENVLYRFDTSGIGAYAQWRDSPPHNDNMMSDLYVEIGIAYAHNANSGRYYFTLLLASRTDYMPNTPIPTPSYTPIAVPTNTSMPVLPTPAPILPTSSPAPTFFVAATWTPPPTTTPILLNQRDNLAVLLNWLPRRLFPMTKPVIVVVAPVPPTPIPQPTITPFPTSTPRPMDLLLVYDYQSFTLLNISGRPLYIDGISFYSPSGEMFGRVWDNGYLTAPLGAFPDGDCLQAWNREYNTEIPKPDFCRYRHSWMRLSDAQTFWRNTDYFDVYQWSDRITTCLISTGRCEVNLRDRLPVPTAIPQVVNPPSQNTTVQTVPTAQSNTTQSQSPARGVADVRLIYTRDSFTLINTAGRNVNLTGLGFAGEGGIISISEWDNGYLSRPLYDFPSGDCVQAWQIGIQNPPAKPNECTWRHSYLTVADYRMFWAIGDAFTVSKGGQVLATCRLSAGVCDFNLP